MLILAYTCDEKWTQANVNISLYVWQKSSWVHGSDRWTLDADLTHRATFFPQIGLATERRSRHWSVVSCVRCGCVGAGLGFPVGNSRFAPVFTPNLRSAFQNHCFSLWFLDILNSWTNDKFKNALNPVRFINMLIHVLSIDSTKC